MTHYAYKYQKYKNKFKQLQQQILVGGESDQEPTEKKYIKIDSLLIYPQKAIVNVNSQTKETELLAGFVEDSVIFLNKDGSLAESTINTNSDTFNEKLYQNAEVLVTTSDGEKVKGTIESFSPKIITIVSDGNFMVIKKWKQIIIEKGRHNKPMVFTTEPGSLQYLVNTIVWSPIYNLYLDSDDLDKSNSGILYVTASIVNKTGYNIIVGRTILVSGNLKMEDTIRQPIYAAQGLRSIGTHEKTEPINEIPFAELLIFPINKKLLIQGERYSIPLYKYQIDAKKIYQFDVNTYANNTNKFVEADHGYKLSLVDRELPVGLLKIFAKSSELKTILLFGSVHIDRTPKDSPIEIMIGKTPRIRANFNRTDSSTNFEKGVINKTRYNITDIKIIGEITNDTNDEQEVTVRDWVGQNTILTIIPKPIRKMGYLEWYFILGPGTTPINISYQIRY